MTATPDPADLEVAIDALYQGALDAFTPARNALAGALRKAGRRDEADRVKALVKPSSTAWAVNQVWWGHPGLVSELLEAGAAERAAHQARGGDRAADVRAAASRRERAVAAVVDGALRTLGRAGAAAGARFRIAGTVEALASSGVPSDVGPGRLIRDLQSSGLSALGAAGSSWAAAAAAPPAPEPPRSRPQLVTTRAPSARPPSGKSAEAVQRQAERLAEAESRVAALEASLQQAASEAAETAASLEEARAAQARWAAEVTGLEQRLEHAREEATRARRALTDATKVASEAELRRARAAREVARLREEIEALKKN